MKQYRPPTAKEKEFALSIDAENVSAEEAAGRIKERLGPGQTVRPALE